GDLVTGDDFLRGQSPVAKLARRQNIFVESARTLDCRLYHPRLRCDVDLRDRGCSENGSAATNQASRGASGVEYSERRNRVRARSELSADFFLHAFEADLRERDRRAAGGC